MIPTQSQNITIAPISTTAYSSTTFMTTAHLTVSALVVQVLEASVGYKLNISQRYCEWNVSQIINAINETDPQSLYSDTYKMLLPQYLPQYIQRQLPPSLQQFYELNFTGIPTQDCQDVSNQPTGNGTIDGLPTIDFCVGPLIHTDLLNVVNEHTEVRVVNVSVSPELVFYINVSLENCGLACSAGADVYGLTDDEQKLVDSFKIVGCSVSFIAMLFLSNEYRTSSKSFRDKTLLQIIPYLITTSGFLTVILMTIGQIVGKESIVCTNNDFHDDLYPNEERLEMSFWNPSHGGNMICTVQGVVFYSTMNMYMFYVVLLSFILFRQLYRPLNPLWRIPQKYWHLFVFILIVFFAFLSCWMNAFSGLYPMGVCFVGQGAKEQLLWLFNIPITICVILSFILLCISGLLIRKELRTQPLQTHNERSSKMQDLLNRMIIYTVCVLLALAIVAYTGFVFYRKSDGLRDGMDTAIQCQLAQILLKEHTDIDCNDLRKDNKISPLYFISWPIGVVFATTAQITLSCHDDMRRRFKQKIRSKIGSLKMISSLSKNSNEVNLAMAVSSIVSEKSISSEPETSTAGVHSDLQLTSKTSSKPVV